VSYVETFIGDDGVPGWECFTCGEEERGFLSFYHAEEQSYRHDCDSRYHWLDPDYRPLPPPRRVVVVELPPMEEDP
jgi:hypothetical protein